MSLDTWEAEAGGLWVPRQPPKLTETISNLKGGGAVGDLAVGRDPVGSIPKTKNEKKRK